MPITTDYEVAHETHAAKLLPARGVDALILCVANAARSSLLARHRAAGATYVLVYNRHPRHPCVSVDGQPAVAALVQRLHALGHRQILMVSGALAKSDRAQQQQQRHLGYLQGMQQVDLAPRLLEVPFFESATERIAARQVGLGVPQDLCIAGFDGITLGEDLTPGLATIVQPNARIGARSVESWCRCWPRRHPCAAPPA